MRRLDIQIGLYKYVNLCTSCLWINAGILNMFKIFLQSSPATTVTSPNTTPAKSIDTSPPVDLFATASTAAPVR